MTAPRFRGVVPPLVTPLRSSPDGGSPGGTEAGGDAADELDAGGMRRLVDHVLAGGVGGLFVLGSSGEGPSLSHRVQREAVAVACEAAGGRAPVLVGVTDTAAEESVALARHAADRGAAAVVLAPPYYFPAGQTELRRYVERLVPRMPLPTVLYNMPSLTKVTFEVETLAALADLDRVVGVKDSGGDFEYFRRVVALKEMRPDWSVLIGPEHLLAESVRAGGDGGVNGGANLFPRLFVRLYDAAAAGDDAAVARLQAQADRLGEIYAVGKYASRHIKAMKSGLSLLGVCGDALAEPFNRFLAPERAKVAAILETLDPELTR